MTRMEALQKCVDVYQLVSFLDRYGNVCKIKANGENWKTWCKQYKGHDGCNQCQVDYWNEVITSG